MHNRWACFKTQRLAPPVKVAVGKVHAVLTPNPKPIYVTYKISLVA